MRTKWNVCRKRRWNARRRRRPSSVGRVEKHCREKINAIAVVFVVRVYDLTSIPWWLPTYLTRCWPWISMRYDATATPSIMTPLFVSYIPWFSFFFWQRLRAKGQNAVATFCVPENEEIKTVFVTFDRFSNFSGLHVCDVLPTFGRFLCLRSARESTDERINSQ